MRSIPHINRWRVIAQMLGVGPASIPFSQLPASAPFGAIVPVRDIGKVGAVQMYQFGTRWGPLNGSCILTQLPAAVSGITNAAESIVMQAWIPAPALRIGDEVQVYADLNKSGTTDGLVYTLRIGTAGTVADTSEHASTLLSAALTGGGFVMNYKIVSATTIQKTGGVASASSYAAPSAAALQTPQTIPNINSNGLFFTVTLKSGGATNTVGIDNGKIVLHSVPTP